MHHHPDATQSGSIEHICAALESIVRSPKGASAAMDRALSLLGPLLRSYPKRITRGVQELDQSARRSGR